MSLINTSPSNDSLVERNIHSLPNENVHLPLTVQSDNELPNIDPSLNTTMKTTIVCNKSTSPVTYQHI